MRIKRGIKALSILCGGILFISPITKISFAQGKDIISTAQKVNDTEYNNEESTNYINKEKTVYNSEKNRQDETVNKIRPKKEEIKSNEKLTSNKTNIIEKENVQSIENVEPSLKEESKVEVIDILNKEQAKDLLNMYHQSVNYMYQGDENTFNTLKDKGLSGYVFLPDYDTDLGFFVDKNTSNIYYFHPSGYLELVM